MPTIYDMSPTTEEIALQRVLGNQALNIWGTGTDCGRCGACCCLYSVPSVGKMVPSDPCPEMNIENGASACGVFGERKANGSSCNTYQCACLRGLNAKLRAQMRLYAEIVLETGGLKDH
ncbi:MAG: hypothetical protein ISS48_02960 [Candidatus Aenigmarchaeota archaeon]|nr:hypothetical protein [Candidatus Aenigmarchaeota archaeon]